MSWIVIGIIGFFGGVVSGLFGVGGGVIFVPLLILLMKFDPHLAIGTSLVAIIPTALVGASRHFSHGWLDIRAALVLALLAMAGAWLGSGISLRMDVTLLRRMFGVFLFLLAFRMFLKS